MALSKQSRIGFVGIGIMGRSMAGHILKAGYPLAVYTRSEDKAETLVAAGARWCRSVAELAASSDVVVTMVGYPADVEQVYLGKDGLVPNAKPGTILIDMTTSEPSLAKRIYEEAKARGVKVLDAPVSGGDIGAREARLAIMVGGDKETFEDVLPLFQCMGQNINLLGPAGSGQHTKMVNQIVIAGTMMGVAEALSYAVKSGLDPNQVLKAIGSGAASSFALNNLGPKMVAGDFAPGFFVHHFIKDMTIAAAEAGKMGLQLQALKLAKSQYEHLAGMGGREYGTQALFKVYER